MASQKQFVKYVMSVFMESTSTNAKFVRRSDGQRKVKSQLCNTNLPHSLVHRHHGSYYDDCSTTLGSNRKNIEEGKEKEEEGNLGVHHKRTG